MIYNQKIEEVVERFDTNLEKGLSDQQVEEKRAQYGFNEIAEAKKASVLVRFLNQFKDAMIIMLIIAAVVSIAVDYHEWMDSLIIMVVVIFNAIIGMTQESKAEESLEALKKMSAPMATVLRNNRKISIPGREVVVGDIVYLEAGDFVSADVRITESYNLSIDESSLTGESTAVSKHVNVIDDENAALGDRKNMAYSSSLVTYGRGVGIVIGIGMETEVGKIADMLVSTEVEPTPLQVKLAQIGKIVGILSLVVVIAVFALEYATNQDMIAAFKTAVALAVAAIPEGLPTVVTVVLSIGVTNMAHHNAIIRRLPAVETLGSASIVCSDKTGTLTQNKMTVTKAYVAGDSLYNLEDALENQNVKEMLDYFTLSSDAEVRIEDGEQILMGDPTETSLVVASLAFNQTKKDLLEKYTYVNEISFDSTRKLMTVVYEVDGKFLSITKGAPDVVLNLSNNKEDAYFEVNNDMASQALRVLAVAYKWLDEKPTEVSPELLENNLTFVGLVGMIDPPRPEVKEAIKIAKGAGVRTVMITGDHIITANAIAKDLGILRDGDLSLSGPELAQLSDEELLANIEKYSVYARVAPEQKVRIVRAWQEDGHVVAMTGDGVNDSPALKAADIGCAMGITGTDVAKGAADMILTDDNFATIIYSIEEGRGIYNNIKKDVHFLLSSNIGEIVAIFFASLIDFLNPGLSFGVPLLPIHLLWVNLITDSLPAFALGMEPVSSDVMLEKPRPKDESLFAHGLMYTIVWQGFMVGGLTLLSYIIGNVQVDHATGMTMAFSTLAISELFHAYNLKSDKSIFNKNIFNNKWLNGAFVVALLLQLVLIYVPFLAKIFNLVNLSLELELISLGLAMAVIPIVEITKLVKRLVKKA
ncbi:MAG: cation-translocating P-type ATPase [Erysipelothrix sp.]|nr:cation-translocating P-type ATPase [Erysipelothrix sp.]